MAALLSQEKIPRNLIDTAIRMAESVADELTRGDDREVCIAHRVEILYSISSDNEMCHEFNLIVFFWFKKKNRFASKNH